MGIMPAHDVDTCPGIGQGERPLLSRDGKMISTFVDGLVMVRPLEGCGEIVSTGIRGAKADISYDDRYVAIHAPLSGDARYDIAVVDLVTGQVRNVTASLHGSSFYPSWTRDGRLSFRYDGDDYHGFMIASDVLSLPPMSATSLSRKDQRSEVRWADVFAGAPKDGRGLTLVLVWGTWNVHGGEALHELEAFARINASVDAMMATDRVSPEDDVSRVVVGCHCDVPKLRLRDGGLDVSGMNNQNPSWLLFRGDKLVSRRLGALTSRQLMAWIHNES